MDGWKIVPQVYLTGVQEYLTKFEGRTVFLSTKREKVFQTNLLDIAFFVGVCG